MGEGESERGGARDGGKGERWGRWGEGGWRGRKGVGRTRRKADTIIRRLPFKIRGERDGVYCRSAELGAGLRTQDRPLALSVV